MKLFDEALAQGLPSLIYHSRFRYCDRVKRHEAVVESFATDRPALALCTQVAEMSLDLSAHLLVTQLAPIPALIQRLGRLNRRAVSDDPWPFVVYVPSSHLPYSKADLAEANRWLESLGEEPLSQRDLVAAWKSGTDAAVAEAQCAWLDGGFETRPNALREGSPGIEIIRSEDRAPSRRGSSRRRKGEFQCRGRLSATGIDGTKSVSARCHRPAPLTMTP